MIGLLQDPERPVGLETEWLDDQAGWLKRAGQRVKGELRAPRRVDQPEADARKWIDEVIGEGSPARFEFARTHVLGREAHDIGLVQLGRGHVRLEALMGRRQSGATLRPVHRLETRVAPGGFVVRRRPSRLDLLPHG